MAQAPPEDIFTRRVCLQLTGMESVAVQRDLDYGPAGRKMDLYYPPRDTGRECWSAVVIVAGYPGAMEPRQTKLSYKQIGWTISMCQLIALSEMVAIAYANQDPVVDLQMLLDYVHDHARILRIDPTRVGVLAVSGNVPTALTTIMNDFLRPPACAVFGYGCLLDLDGAADVSDTARQFGFVNPNAGRTFADLRPDVPLLLTRAGRDSFPATNASIDRFVAHALVANLPVTLVNYAEGVHAFDLFEDSRASRDVVRQTLRFLRQHLTAGNPGADAADE